MLENHNGAQFRSDSTRGHYESFFLRGNHSTRALAFWIRYTVFSPRHKPNDAIGELWAVVSNAESGTVIAAKTEVPIRDCVLNPQGLSVKAGQATLDDGTLHGAAASSGHDISWNLRYHGNASPVLLLPEKLYSTGFPKAKSLVSLPMAKFNGQIQVDGEAIPVVDWIGSQNHNWGSRHTDRYAYGQVCGFDNAPDSFLEIATARVKLGPLWTPAMTPLVLRHAGEEFALNSVWQSLRAQASYEYFCWRFRSQGPGVVVQGEITAPREHFVGLRYYNPPGGNKTCLNSKIAACVVELKRDGLPAQMLSTRHRAAFEILTDDSRHGVEIKA
jgi:hypothetical protein